MIIWAGFELASTSESLNRIIKYYSYLFTFPSRNSILISIFLISLFSGILSHLIVFGLQSVFKGVLYGMFGLAFPIFISDLLTQSMYKHETILNPRRFNILSFCSCIIFFIILLFYSLLSIITNNSAFLMRGIVLTSISSIGIRTLILLSFTKGIIKNLITAIIQPLLIFIMSVLLDNNLLSVSFYSVFFSASILFLGALVVIFTLALWKIDDLRIIPLFRAFMSAWTEQYNEPLEHELLKFSKETTVEIDKLSYFDSLSNILGNLIVPYVHPGPFRNVGSSALSLEICKEFETLTLVTHGISTHETDMASSSDLRRIISDIKNSTNSINAKKCTPLIREEVKGAKASCQIFGKVALISLTLSPQSHDDLPNIVKDSIQKEAKKLGYEALVIDAHNCLDFNELNTEYEINNLISAAYNALYKASSTEQYSFSIGFSKVNPKEWGVGHGMGTCGIGLMAITTQAGGKYVYVVVDSNNVIKGLREVILSKLFQLGFDEGEILSSYTHLVNAVGASTQGYHPFGELIDWKSILTYIEQAYSKLQMVSSSVNLSRSITSGIKIIGSDGIRLIREIIIESFKRFVIISSIAIPVSFICAGLVILL